MHRAATPKDRALWAFITTYLPKVVKSSSCPKLFFCCGGLSQYLWLYSQCKNTDMQESFKRNKISYLVPQLEDLIQIGTVGIYHNGIRVSINHFEVHLNETNHFEKQNPSVTWKSHLIFKTPRDHCPYIVT